MGVWSQSLYEVELGIRMDNRPITVQTEWAVKSAVLMSPNWWVFIDTLWEFAQDCTSQTCPT